MSDTREKISALVDSELVDDGTGNLLEEVKSDAELRQAWGRYHLIGDVMRGEAVNSAVAQIADHVSEQLKDEPAMIAAPKSPLSSIPLSSRWIKPAAGAAIAASVAVLAVVALPQLSDSDISPTVPAGLQVAAVPVEISSPPEKRKLGGTRWKNLAEPEVESRLNRYLVDHSEYASPGGMTGMMPYSTFVSYDIDQ
ncbi:MAG: sigma-E factor negative regulatory protein [Gammaproteobacteria bacterium]|nr:sigma-E factor negative regulatory protein [Gammaproteobacteria bacterium]